MVSPHDTSRIDFTEFHPQHFLWSMDGKVATITLNRPERKNPLTFESLRGAARFVSRAGVRDAVKAVVHHRRGRQFLLWWRCARIIGPLVRMQEADDMQGLMTSRA